MDCLPPHNNYYFQTQDHNQIYSIIFLSDITVYQVENVASSLNLFEPDYITFEIEEQEFFTQYSAGKSTMHLCNRSVFSILL